MKRIIINESKTDIIYNYIKSQSLSKRIINALKHHKTSLGQHPAFPPEEEYPFDEKITNERFNEIKKSLEKLSDEITNFSEENITNTLSKLIKECQEKEKPIRQELEKICAKSLHDLFDIPEETIIYTCKLTDRIDSKNHSLRLTPESSDDIEFSDVFEMENISDEVYKRRLINALIVGASMYYPKILSKSYLSEIFELNSKLPELYSKIILLNNLLLFIKNDIEITDENPMQGGVVNVTLGNETTKSKIDVEAMTFPILLSESIKGFMELFASHGLPKRKDLAIYVTKKADFLIAEPWDMRLGPVLWEYFINSMKPINSKILPNIFSAVIELSPKDFFILMKEIFAKTKKSKKLMSFLVDKVIDQIDYDDFEDRITNKQNDFNTLEDQYIQADELIDNNLNESRHKEYGGFKYLRSHTIPLSDDEIKFFKENDLTWPGGEIIIHKAKAKNEKDGEVYFAWTHRAWNVCKTKKEAIKLGKFIKSTA